jgi:deoxyribose-phosphate aldolase
MLKGRSMTMEKMNFASIIDSALLESEKTLDQLEALCAQAVSGGYAAVAVMPYRVKQAAKLLEGSNVRVCAAIGFPFGMTTPEVKAFEAIQAVDNGAMDIDMVINVGAIKDRNFDVVYNDIKGVVEAAKAQKSGVVVKVILETCLLTDDEKVIACKIAEQAGADFVKTSTGFNADGATVHDIELMYKAVGDKIGVKAAGRVRTYDDAVKFTNAGATRIGCSARAAACIVSGE